jgi:predicted RNA-binding protein with TRAM domain
MFPENLPTDSSIELPVNSHSMKQGDVVEIQIVDVSESGEGVGRVNDRVVFVPDTVTGDRITARITHVKRQYAHGKLLEVIEASPHRVRPSCIVADKCGGCQLQHIDYDYQLAAKENQVLQALKRIGGFAEPPVAPIVGAQGNFVKVPIKSSISINVPYKMSGSIRCWLRSNKIFKIGVGKSISQRVKEPENQARAGLESKSSSLKSKMLV